MEVYVNNVEAIDIYYVPFVGVARNLLLTDTIFPKTWLLCVVSHVMKVASSAVLNASMEKVENIAFSMQPETNPTYHYFYIYLLHNSN